MRFILTADHSSLQFVPLLSLKFYVIGEMNYHTQNTLPLCVDKVGVAVPVRLILGTDASASKTCVLILNSNNFRP